MVLNKTVTCNFSVFHMGKFKNNTIHIGWDKIIYSGGQTTGKTHNRCLKWTYAGKTYYYTRWEYLQTHCADSPARNQNL